MNDIQIRERLVELQRQSSRLQWARDFAAACDSSWSAEAIEKVNRKLQFIIKEIFDLEAAIERKDEVTL